MSAVTGIEGFETAKANQNNIPVSKLIAEWPPGTLPLVDFQKNIGLVWSARSACSLSIFWYYAVTGQIREAIDFAPWPHKYRTRILNGIVLKSAQTSTLGTRDIKWVRVMRDPFKRAVSSYRHFVKHNLEKETADRFFGGDVGERGLSFEEFLDYAKSRNIRTCDIHFRQQWNDSEKFCGNIEILNADKCDLKSELFKKFDACEENLKIYNEAEEYIFERHVSKSKNLGNSDSKAVFNAKKLKEFSPSVEVFDNACTRESVREIYAEDYDRFEKYI